MGRLGWVLVVVLIVGVVGVHYATNSNARFCLTHTCIANFGSGHGSIVECSDGTWSHSGGTQGACSYHGGESSEESSSGDASGGSGYGSGGSGYGSGGAGAPASKPPPTPSPAVRARAAARRRADARAAKARRAAAARAGLFAITDTLVALDNRVASAHGRGTSADVAELDHIQTRLTSWQVAHALDGPIGGPETPLQKVADSAFGLDTTLELVIADRGGGIWTPEWNHDVAAYKAAVAAVH